VRGLEDMQKQVEDWKGARRGQEGQEEVGKTVGEGGRGRRTWESNGTLQQPLIPIFLTYLHSHASLLVPHPFPEVVCIFLQTTLDLLIKLL